MDSQGTSTFLYCDYNIIIPDDLSPLNDKLVSLQEQMLDEIVVPDYDRFVWVAVLDWHDGNACLLFWGPNFSRDELWDWLFPVSLVERRGRVVAGVGIIPNEEFSKAHFRGNTVTYSESLCDQYREFFRFLHSKQVPRRRPLKAIPQFTRERPLYAHIQANEISRGPHSVRNFVLQTWSLGYPADFVLPLYLPVKILNAIPGDDYFALIDALARFLRRISETYPALCREIENILLKVGTWTEGIFSHCGNGPQKRLLGFLRHLGREISLTSGDTAVLLGIQGIDLLARRGSDWLKLTPRYNNGEATLNGTVLREVDHV
ncbi:hypothetical protein T440DRAFT_523675 [Plenodomus tracheiphilus IPT5]|uniref:Uncharacterized protein n=1 Tax=Plenodomus tracheiphilus IPT5 TaxID=1408161 RepID=A0A6A7AM57_9PLEO|nr:hypothetical protein T440DRAFT_523675 [Plenodomus tracheiphilus IPT5]